MQIAVLQQPGKNCEPALLAAMARVGMTPVIYTWGELQPALADAAGYIIAGPMGSADYLQAERIAHTDPTIALLQQQSDSGKPVLGIGFGAQVVVAAGLVPGLLRHQVGIAVTDARASDGQTPSINSLRLRKGFQYNAFTRSFSPSQALPVTVAAAPGNFVIPPGLLAEMQVQGQDVFHYCEAEKAQGFLNCIAGVTNKAGNVLALLAHPELTPAGDIIFASMVEHITKAHYIPVAPLFYQPRLPFIRSYQREAHAVEWLVNVAAPNPLSLERMAWLQAQQIRVQLTQYLHWEITSDDPTALTALQQASVLYDATTMTATTHIEKTDAMTRLYLLRPHNSALDRKLQQRATAIAGIETIRAGIVWEVQGTTAAVNAALKSAILFNPLLQECYVYA